VLPAAAAAGNTTKTAFQTKTMSELFLAVDSQSASKVASVVTRARDQINQIDKNANKTPLYLACEDGKIDIVRLLLDNGAQTTLACTGAKSFPLHAAAFYGMIHGGVMIKVFFKKTK
jgi:ankyrin repeat protein